MSVRLAPWSPPTITRERIQAYVDTTGDPNPVHTDDDYARSVGFPSVIASGGMIVALLGSYVSRARPDASVEHLEVRLLSPILPDDAIEIEGRVDRPAGVEDGDTETWICRVQARVGERAVAVATARLAPGDGRAGQGPRSEKECA